MTGGENLVTENNTGTIKLLDIYRWLFLFRFIHLEEVMKAGFDINRRIFFLKTENTNKSMIHLLLAMGLGLN